jgi:hypothetical protein
VKRQLLPWLALGAIALIYPLVVLAGGAARFPTRDDCAHPATSDGNIEAVFARFSTIEPAESLQKSAAHAGFHNVRVEPDGCGLFKVTLHGIPTLAVGRDFVHEAEGAGFHPTLEQDVH